MLRVFLKGLEGLLRACFSDVYELTSAGSSVRREGAPSGDEFLCGFWPADPTNKQVVNDSSSLFAFSLGGILKPIEVTLDCVLCFLWVKK